MIYFLLQNCTDQIKGLYKTRLATFYLTIKLKHLLESFLFLPGENVAHFVIVVVISVVVVDDAEVDANDDADVVEGGVKVSGDAIASATK